MGWHPCWMSCTKSFFSPIIAVLGVCPVFTTWSQYKDSQYDHLMMMIKELIISNMMIMMIVNMKELMTVGQYDDYTQDDSQYYHTMTMKELMMINIMIMMIINMIIWWRRKRYNGGNDESSIFYPHHMYYKMFCNFLPSSNKYCHRRYRYIFLSWPSLYNFETRLDILR